MFAASENISRREFQAYMGELDLEQNYPGILGLAFALNIAPDELERHIANIRAEGFPQYTLSPDGDREQYTAILFIEPFSGNNLKAFGFYMYSESVRREAMDRARLNSELALSGKVSLVQDVGRGPIAGVLLYLPVYQRDVNQTADDTGDFLGWVYAPFSMDILMEGIQLDESLVGLGIYDGASVSAEAQLYSSRGNLQQSTGLPFWRTEQLVIAQRPWTIVFSADSSFVQAHDNTEPEVVLLVGGLFTVLMALFVWSLSSAKERAETKAAAMNRELSEAEFRWKAALSGAGHGVWDWNNLTNAVTFDTKWKSILGYADDEIENNFSEWQRLVHPLTWSVPKRQSVTSSLVRPRLMAWNTGLKPATDSGCGLLPKGILLAGLTMVELPAP